MSEHEKTLPHLSIIITMCLQNDFIRKLDDIPNSEWKIFPQGVHISEDETTRLWSNNLDGFIDEIMQIGKKFESDESNNAQYFHFIHIRDWHDDTDPSISVQKELATYGLHCIKGTEGARFIQPLENYIRLYRTLNLVVNSNSLNSFVETDLDLHLNSIAEIKGCSKGQITIGIIGVATNIKILFLIYDLVVRFGYTNVYLCDDLCAAFDAGSHVQGLAFIENILGIEHLNLEDFREKLNISNY